MGSEQSSRTALLTHSLPLTSWNAVPLVDNGCLLCGLLPLKQPFRFFPSSMDSASACLIVSQLLYDCSQCCRFWSLMILLDFHYRHCGQHSLYIITNAPNWTQTVKRLGKWNISLNKGVLGFSILPVSEHSRSRNETRHCLIKLIVWNVRFPVAFPHTLELRPPLKDTEVHH